MSNARIDNEGGKPDAQPTKRYARPVLMRYGHVPMITGSKGGSMVDPNNPFTGFNAPN